MPMGPMGDYCFVDHGGDTIGAMMRKPPEVPVGLWNYYIRVADIEAATATVRDLGGQVLASRWKCPAATG